MSTLLISATGVIVTKIYEISDGSRDRTGEVSFDPYEYEYVGSSDKIRQLLENWESQIEETGGSAAEMIKHDDGSYTHVTRQAEETETEKSLQLMEAILELDTDVEVETSW